MGKNQPDLESSYACLVTGIFRAAACRRTGVRDSDCIALHRIASCHTHLCAPNTEPSKNPIGKQVAALPWPWAVRCHRAPDRRGELGGRGAVSRGDERKVDNLR